MFFNSLAQLSNQEKETLEKFSISETAKEFLAGEIGRIANDYFEIEQKAEMEPEILKQLLELKKLENNPAIKKAAEKIKKGEADPNKLLADEAFFKSLGSAGLGELINIAFSVEENLIIPENIKFLCLLIDLRNQIKIEEKHYYEKLEQIALREKIRRLQKRHDLLLRRKKILMEAEGQGEINSLRQSLK